MTQAHAGTYDFRMATLIDNPKRARQLARAIASDLTLYHEVSVFDAGNQHFEYINCHSKTGVMRAV